MVGWMQGGAAIEPLEETLQPWLPSFQVHTAWWLALAAALRLDALVTVEWASHGCQDDGDGAVPAIYGFPLPNTEFAGSSLDWYVAIHTWAFDVGICAFTLWWPLRWAVARAQETRRATYGSLGAGAVALQLAGKVALVGLGCWIPTRGMAVWHQDLRPIGITVGFELPYHCDPDRPWIQ